VAIGANRAELFALHDGLLAIAESGERESAAQCEPLEKELEVTDEHRHQ
jgi:hypothetical protein